jgi:hypothetical protein
MSYSKLNRGSEWRRWDLHVHTKGTMKSDRFTSPDFDSYCRKLFTEAIANNIAVIGITDYFSLENYKKVIDYQSNVATDTNFSDEQKEIIQSITLLPNMELRMMPCTGAKKLVNVHMIINPNFVGHFENHYLAKITLSSSDSNLTPYSLTQLGKASNPQANDEAAYKAGIQRAVIDSKTLAKLKNDNLDIRENVLFAVSNSKSDGASAMQEHYTFFEGETGNLSEVRKSIYLFSDIIFSGNPKDATFFLGQKISVEDVVQKCGSLKPCIHGSDAHTEDELFMPDEQRNCWIKADPTFEGLKQIVCEPGSRVKIQLLKPEEKNPNNVIKSFTTADGQCLELNPNMNTIIGGRSSGKSALLASMAYKCAWPFKDDKYKKFLENTLKVEGAKLEWLNAQLDATHPIEYFPQKFLYEMQDKGLTNIILPILKQKGLTSHIETLNIQLSQIKTQIGTDVEQWFVTHNDLSALKTKQKELGAEDTLRQNIQSLEEKIKQIKAANSVSDADHQYDQNKIKEVTQLQTEQTQMSSDLTLLPTIQELTLFNPIASQLHGLSQANQEQIQSLYKEVVQTAKEQWEAGVKKMLAQVENDHNTVVEKLKTILADQQFLSIRDKYKAMQGLEPLQERLDTAQKEQKEFEIVRGSIDTLDTQQSETQTRLRENFSKYKKVFEATLPQLTLPADSDLEIKALMKFKSDGYKTFIENAVNLKASSERDLLDFEYIDFDSFIVHIFQLFDRAKAGELPLKGAYASNHRKFSSDLLSEPWHEIDYDIVYEDDSFAQMSEGKRAFVVLKLLLEFSDKKCPILIDQPEDDLDNRAIFKELVGFLKKQKSIRQIILVTHNANVVVNADSELVIVANQQGAKTPNTAGKKFEYVAGSLEFTKPVDNTEPKILYQKGIREHVCEILEGGNEAFKLRERKYAIR